MEAVKALVDHLASPPWLFTLALALFLACRRSRHPWTLAGGVAFFAATAAVAGLGLADEDFRRLVLHPERLPVAVLCLSSLALLWFEMRRIHRGGDAAAPGGPAAQDRRFSSADAVAATAIGLVVVACALIHPPRLGAPADPGATPDFVKAPWFLTGVQELGHYFHPWVAYAAVPSLLLAGLLGLPRLAAAGVDAGRRGRGLFLFGWLFLWLWPMVVGALLRGPGWRAFGPFEPWETRPAELAPQPVSEIFWSRWLGTLEPASWWLRELPGMVLLAAYFVLLPLGLRRWKATRGLLAGTVEALGPWRFHLAAAWVQALLLVPLAMYGRWLFDAGPWIHLPELPFFRQAPP